MAQTPVTGGSGVPTGNALTDAANSVLTVDPAQAAAAVNAVNASNASVASDCLWPPSGQVSIPIIPGIYTQSINIPCLVSYSEARALVGAGLLVAGLLVMQLGVTAIVAAAVAPGVLRAVGFGAGAAAVEGAAEAPAAEAAAPRREVADERGTSPEFRKRYGLAG